MEKEIIFSEKSQENDWDTDFETGRRYTPLRKEHVKKIADRLPDEAKVMEIGCGDGALLSQLKETGKQFHLSGMDVSGKAIEEAKKNIPEVEFKKLDITKEDIPEKSDVIVMKFALGCLRSKDSSSQEELWESVFKKIKNNCQYFVLITPVLKEGIDTESAKPIFVPQDMLDKLFDKHFEQKEILSIQKGNREFDYAIYLASKPRK